MPEHDTPADEPPVEATADTSNPVTVQEPAALFARDDVTTEVVEVEAGTKNFEQYQDRRGMAIAGITNDDGEVLLVKNTDPDVCHDWVLPHGVVADEDDGWVDTAADWVDGLTGVSAGIKDVVHVRRNDISHETDDGETRGATTYHVIYSGSPNVGEEIQDDVRYDCDDVWTADWHDSIPDSARETESQDIARFVD